MPRDTLEIGTSFGEPSKGFSPAKPIRNMVLKTQITITVNGMLNQTNHLPIIGFVSEISKPIEANVGIIAIGNSHINKCTK